MNPELTLKDYADALGELLVSQHGSLDTVILSATDDSRKVAQGSLFCAIKGERFDGHAFIPQAVAQGAVAIVLNEIPDDLPASLPYLQVSDSYRAAGIVAELAAGKPAQHFKVIAVTGTNGKTTTAYLLREVFRTAGFPTAMIGTVEYDLGNGEKIAADRTTPTPFFLQNLFTEVYNNNVCYCVMEMSSHAIVQQRLGTIKVDGAIFTNLTQDHLDFHKTLENYYQAKKLLFTRHLKPDAPVVINADDPFGQRLADELTHNLAGVDVISFSLKNLCTPVCVYVKDLKLSSKGTECALSFPDGNWLMTSPLAGLYNGYNLAGVAILAHALGMPYPTVKQALATCLGAPGRLQKVTSSHHKFTVFIDYAHTPDALSNVIDTVRDITLGRVIVVFGCGGDRDRTKRPVMGKIVADKADVCIITSDNPRTESPDAIISDILAGMPKDKVIIVDADRRAAIRHAIQTAKPGDSIIIAVKGHEDYQEINVVKHHFSDYECVQALL
ncbi:MAG: UDP-N-acetylmuramoyl-L-alanyl-D-glutamate--2,6-diaminopimelate ligase [Victivallales bacterium]|nr:UDP-N-acetylmuramoyl-L-alanyl-D-glutamate--2,6-diaminopimelate ligase [Victivallales bacterium]